MLTPNTMRRIVCVAQYTTKGGVRMEAQMKRGFLEACVLAAVSGEESYGY